MKSLTLSVNIKFKVFLMLSKCCFPNLGRSSPVVDFLCLEISLLRGRIYEIEVMVRGVYRISFSE